MGRFPSYFSVLVDTFLATGKWPLFDMHCFYMPLKKFLTLPWILIFICSISFVPIFWNFMHSWLICDIQTVCMGWIGRQKEEKRGEEGEIPTHNTESTDKRNTLFSVE